MSGVMDRITPPPPNSYVDVNKSLPQNVTVFGNRVFKEVIQIKQVHMGGTLIQYDWCI